MMTVLILADVFPFTTCWSQVVGYLSAGRNLWVPRSFLTVSKVRVASLKAMTEESFFRSIR